MAACSNGGESGIDGPEQLDELEHVHDELTVSSGTQARAARPIRRKQAWLKNITAVLIGMVAGILIRLVINVPWLLFFPTDDGRVPRDIEVVIE